MAIIGNPIIAAVKTEVDDRFDEYSTNPVQNKVITNYIRMPDLTLYQDEETKYVYVATQDGVLLGDGILVEGGGGGGGGTGGVTYKPKLTNLMSSREIAIAKGGKAILRFNYTSVDEDGMDDGPGVGTITITGSGDKYILRTGIPQGDNALDVTEHLGDGNNTVIIKVENSEGASKQLKYTISIAVLSISTTFNELANYSGSVDYSYTVSGVGTKVVHFIMDGRPIGTEEVTTSNRTQTFTIPEQSYGGHVFEVYATLNAEGLVLTSDTLRHGMLWLNSTSTRPAIASTFNVTEAVEGDILSIPYIAYDPMQETAAVTITVLRPNNSVYYTNTTNVDRLPHTWHLTQFPSGNIRVILSCGNARCEFPIAVEANEFPVQEVTDRLVLKFDAEGRSNGEENPAHWSYDDISATFTGFGWASKDGWLPDDDGVTTLRFLPGDSMFIPFYPFATDARIGGFTIEAELATKDVRDYKSLVMSCLDNGRGFHIASQEAGINSEQAGISIMFREDTKIRIAFSVEDRNLNRFIYTYINGILCGVTQYKTDDNFQQQNPVGITIGAQSCGIDLYRIRCYKKGLTRAEQLDNFIIDRPTLTEREDAYQRNNILDANEEVSIATLPQTIPYFVIRGPQLPQSKDDDDATVEIEYVDPLHPNRSWVATGVKIGIQGTSSAGYPIKNWKFKLKKGIVYTNWKDEDGEAMTDVGFPIHEGEMPTKTICWKADFASSENANNVVLAKFYNDLCVYKTPAQQDNAKIRQGIDGFPAVLFWADTSTGTTKFLGKGNCNVDKGNDDIFGLTTAYPKAQSWEFLNNTSDRSLFKSTDFTSDGVDKNGNPIKAWQNDFEARYPDDSLDISDFARMAAWVVSTDRGAVTSAADKAARLQKFHDEFEDHFVLQAMLFYYVFTSTFLLMDNRAKNMFLTTYDGEHWFSLPYDFDSCLGINNEGSLAYEYNLEDTDIVDGDVVYTGQNSVLWNNFRDAFQDEIRDMYVSLRSMSDGDASHESPFSYYRVAKLFTEHQSVWPEALWNEDAFTKYIQPYLVNGEDYLDRLQGDKSSQRDWWLYGAFGYWDSKFQCGDAAKNRIILRCYSVADITITPYSHIYGRIRYGSYDTVKRCERDKSYVMECGADEMYDTETYIYSADRISSIGDLSPLTVGEFNSAAATKLREIKLGDEDPNYENLRLGVKNSVTVGNNNLLESVNVANCKLFGTGTQKVLDLSGCSGLKEVIATGTQLRGVSLPNGGHLQTLKLPSTITNFTVQNQANLQAPVFEGYGNLETLRVENTPNIPIETLILQNPNLSRLRLMDLDWTVSSASALQQIYDRLVAENTHGDRIIGGLDAEGMNTPTAVISGIVRVSESVSSALLAGFTDNFPDLLVIANGQATCTVRFRDWDGTLLNTQTCSLGGSVQDPVAAHIIETPTREAANRMFYTYSGWNKPLTNIQSNLIVTAVYTEEPGFQVDYVNDDAAETLLYTTVVREGQTAPDPVALEYIDEPTKPTDSQYSYTYLGWDSSLYNITRDKVVKARYATEPSVTVIFANWDNTPLFTKYIASGEAITDPLQTGDITEEPTRPRDTTAQVNYVYAGWDHTLTNITENVTIKATFTEIQYYIITFQNPDGVGGDLNLPYTTTVNRGGRVTDPVASGDLPTPTRYPESTYSYIYKGWDAELSTNVTSNLTYTATYKTDRMFTVTFVDWDGTTLSGATQLVADEDAAVDPVTSGRIAQPARAPSDQYTYTYNGWDKAFNFITEDTTVTATYTQTVRQYPYRFLNNDNSVLKSGTVDYGTVVTPPSNPSHVPANEEMVFNGWGTTDFRIVRNTDFIAQYLDMSSVTVKYLKRTLTEYESDTATEVGAYAFYNFTSLASAETSATTIGTSAFQGCANLTTVDLTGTGATTIAASAFSGDTKLEALIIRSNTVATLANVNALSSTLIAAEDGAVYVPTALVDSYKAATNWSTYASQIYPISAYPVTDFSTISDSWAEIFAAEDNGTYATKYQVGDKKQIVVNGTTAYAVIAAMDADTLADNSGNAKITWVLDRIITTHAMNSTATNADGWPTTEMRTWLSGTILPTIDETIRNNIKEVSKTSYDYTTKADVTSTDKLWLPSMREVFGGTSYEQSGPIYSGLFKDANSRIRRQSGAANYWWLRSAISNSGTYFWCVNNNGASGNSSANYQYGVAFGFCT